MNINIETLTKEEINSWYLEDNTEIDEETFLKCGFYKYAHVVGNWICLMSRYIIYKRDLFENELYLLDMRYSFYIGYAGIFITNKETNICFPCFEEFGKVYLGRRLKFFFKHRALHYIKMAIVGEKIKKLPKSFVFDADFRRISYYKVTI